MSIFDSPPSQSTLEDLLEGDVRLASPPEVFARLRHLLNDPDSTLPLLADTIERDPALSARLLRLANSAFFSLPGKVASISEAVSIVGIREIQDLVLATEVIQRFDNVPEDLVDIYSFWRDSLRCAVLSHQLGRLLPQPQRDEPLFLSGLLHDIGHLVIYSRLPEAGRKALLEHRHRGIPLHEAEQSVLGFDYTQVGAALARRWALPEVLCTVLNHHLHPEQAEHFTESVRLVHLAREIALLRSFEQTSVTALLEREASLLQATPLTAEQVTSLLPEAENAFGAALALLR